MRDLRKRYNYTQRMELHRTMLELRPYILPLLLDRQGYKCPICHCKPLKWDIDHKIYNPMETINELQALCIPCHKSITDYRPMKYRTCMT